MSEQDIPGLRCGAAARLAGVLAAVDVQDLAGDEAGRLEVDDGVHDVARLAHPADRVQAGERLVVLDRVHRGLDDTRRDGVDPDAPAGVLDGQGLGRGVEATLGQRRQDGWHAAVRLVDEAGRDADDVTAAARRADAAAPAG